MRSVAIIIASICALLSSFVSVGSGSPARATELPDYLQGLVGTSGSSAGEVATKNILQLNTSMFDLYAEAGLTFRKNILAQGSGDPRVVLGCRRTVHSLPAGCSAAECAVDASRLFTAQPSDGPAANRQVAVFLSSWLRYAAIPPRQDRSLGLFK
jgi:hypothetical protein